MAESWALTVQAELSGFCPAREITVYDLLTHSAGLSYGGYEETGIPVDKLYDEADLENAEMDNEEMVRRIASLPLMYHPGEKWFYGVATDVAGHLVEVISGMGLDAYFEEKNTDTSGHAGYRLLCVRIRVGPIAAAPTSLQSAIYNA